MDLQFERKSEETSPRELLVINTFGLSRRDVQIKSYDGDAQILYNSINAQPERACYFGRVPDRKDPNGLVVEVSVPINEAESTDTDGKWLWIRLKPDTDGFRFFAIDASLQDTPSRSTAQEHPVRLACNPSREYRPSGTEGQRVFAFREYAESLPVPLQPIVPPDEVQSLWEAYVDALEALAKQQMLFFKIERVGDQREDEQTGDLVIDIYYSMEALRVDNTGERSTILNDEDFLAENRTNFKRQLWQAIKGQRFAVIDEAQREELMALLNTDRSPRLDDFGTDYLQLSWSDPSESRLSFRVNSAEEETIPDVEPGQYLVPKMAGEIAQTRRLKIAFDLIKKRKIANPNLSAAIFDATSARQATLPPPHSDEYADIRANLLQTSLNNEQFESVLKAVYVPDLCLIQGPPGTGKTTVIAEIVYQMIRRQPGARILIASQTHLAVDNALEKLRNSRSIVPIRIASSREASEAMEQEGFVYSPDLIRNWVKEGDTRDGPTDNAITRDLDERLRTIPDVGHARVVLERYRNRARGELHRIDRSDLWDYYSERVNVVAATCAESGRKDFRETWARDGFDVVLIDEVSKATPPELFVPIVHAKKVVLIGDHRQLPPMIDEDLIEQRLREANYTEIEDRLDEMRDSLFERLFATANESIKTTLRVQYRMHPHIERVINQFYEQEGGLLCGLPEDSVDSTDFGQSSSRHHGLKIGALLQPRDHVLWVDVPDGSERRDGTSYVNDKEVDAVLQILQLLVRSEGWSELDSNITPEVGVISFYGAQVAALYRRISSDRSLGGVRVRVRPVDRFQGMEREIVVVSLVRSSTFYDEYGNRHKNSSIGFAKDYRRVNVALSRARRLLIIVGDRSHFEHAAAEAARKHYRGVTSEIDVVGGYKKIEQFESYAETHGEHR